MKILIIDDDVEFAEALCEYLELHDAECDFAYHGEAGLTLASENPFDLVILDVNMPKMNGFEVCTQLRQRQVLTPILMMTAFDATEDQLSGFRAGVDDYVVKPCAMPLVWARIEALVRRSQPQQREFILGPLTLDLDQQLAHREGANLALSPTLWRILLYLVQQHPRVVPRSELEQEIWQGEVEPGNLSVQLHKLRSVLDKPFQQPMIHTRIGAGIEIREPQ